VRRVITGDWASGQRERLAGGFRFVELKRKKIDAEAVNALAREEMIDLLLTSYWDKAERAKSDLRRLPIGQHRFPFAVNAKDEGFFLVWRSADTPSVLNRDVFKGIVAEAKVAGLAPAITSTPQLRLTQALALSSIRYPTKCSNTSGSIRVRTPSITRKSQLLELKVFQSDTAKTMADRYAFFANHPERPRRGNKPRPFFQALSALTGAGKTPILAQAVALMRAHFGTEPIVLWMSKAKSVVAQTYTNFSSGKYSEIIEGFRVSNIQGLTPQLIEDGDTPLLLMTTTGLFNNKDQSEGALNIYKKDNDRFGNQSPWERMIERKHDDKRRPLLIVYDEGHNLS
jgi:hypothetical protein